MRRVTGNLPKALIPILGKPFIHYQLAWLAAQGVRDVIVSVGYGGDLVADAVGTGSRFDITVSYSNEGTDLRGTGGALRLAADRGLLAESFFVLYGDSYLPIDLGPVWQTSENGNICTMVTIRNQGHWDRSNVIVHKSGFILYDKFSSTTQMEFIDYGVSVMRRDVIIERIPSGAKADLAHLLNALSLAGNLKGHIVEQRFYEIGSPQGLIDFENYVRNRPETG